MELWKHWQYLNWSGKNGDRIGEYGVNAYLIDIRHRVLRLQNCKVYFPSIEDNEESTHGRLLNIPPGRAEHNKEEEIPRTN